MKSFLTFSGTRWTNHLKHHQTLILPSFHHLSSSQQTRVCCQYLLPVSASAASYWIIKLMFTVTATPVGLEPLLFSTVGINNQMKVLKRFIVYSSVYVRKNWNVTENSLSLYLFLFTHYNKYIHVHYSYGCISSFYSIISYSIIFLYLSIIVYLVIV